MATDPWSDIHTERAALADDLAGLTAEQWASPSLCEGWTIHQALGHVVTTAKMTPPKFIGGFIGSGFNFTKFTAKGVVREASGTPTQTLAELRAHLKDTTSPPGPTEAMVGEIVLHSVDIRRPLGISHTTPIGTARRVADFYKGSNLIVGAKTRIAGVKLVASDDDWSHGDGPEVRGPLLSLALAMTGRGIALDDLTGEGVATLRSRIE